MLRYPVIALGLIALVCACGGGATGEGTLPTATSEPVSTVGSCSPARGAAGDSAQTVLAGGRDRRFLLHVPAGYDGTTAAPLVVAFHDASSTPEGFAGDSRLATATDTAGAVVAWPVADSAGGWNDAADAARADDVSFMRELLATLDASLCIDGDRTFVAGYGAGGGMALRVACAMEDEIAAVAVVASSYPNCRANVPLIAFHGMNDAQIPFEGATRTASTVGSLPVRRLVSEWAREAGCDGLPIISRPSNEVEVSTFNRCRGGDGEVLLYTIIGGGHIWPGAAPGSGEITTPQTNASRAIAEFFATHPPAKADVAAVP
ncbi:MAG TPA: PHB depolymerase family esterase [Dehalococcoidia bacterium]